MRDPSDRAHKVIWPAGFFARYSIGGLMLSDGHGVVAYTGDRLRIEGAPVDSGAWLACGAIQRLAQ